MITNLTAVLDASLNTTLINVTVQAIHTDQWVATAQIANFSQLNRSQSRRYQSLAVRTLLSLVWYRAGIRATLIDEQFPYYFIHDNQRYYVCFSHSADRVALVISLAPCAIDIEMRDISLRVAARFFHSNELTAISQISEENLQNLMINRLWQLKEAMIKLNSGKLYRDLGQDFSSLVNGLQKPCATSLTYANHPIICDANGRWVAVF